MGSYFSFGINSIQSIDDTITNMIFQPPPVNDSFVKKLYNKPNYNFKKIDGISILEITPRLKLSNKILIFSHGNASDIFHMSSYLEELANNLGIMVVCYDYPGYGLSTGKLSENKCYDAINIVVSYYRTIYSEAYITLVGQSLGTGIVMHFVSTNNWTTPVILISPYKSITRVVYDIPVECSFSHNTFSTLYKLDRIMCPVKIFHGKSDELIPYTHAEYIYKKIPNKAFMPTYYDNVGHNDILNVIKVNEYQQVIDPN